MSGSNLDNMRPEEILEMQKKNCIFCKIIHHEIPSNEIYSDEKVSVILDINPANEGHLLILPKTHYQILPQIPDEVIGYLSVITKRASRALLKALGSKGTSVFIANGALAGQKAPHFMVHVIPRKTNDLLMQLPKKSIDEKKLDEIKVNLRSKMAVLTGQKSQAAPKAIGHDQPEKAKDKVPEHKIEEKSEDKEIEKPEHKDKKLDLDKIAGLFD